MSASALVKRARQAAHLVREGASHLRSEAGGCRRGWVKGPESVLLIVGCQRSGTTLMTKIFAADPAAKVYPEYSWLSARDAEQLRLDPLPSVRRRIEASHFPLVVLKPLVESQNTIELLDAIPNSRALWMYRRYQDVAASNLAKFGMHNGIRDLRLALANGPREWRGEGASEETIDLVRGFFSESMNPWDAAALFWAVRNRFYFDQQLASNPKVRLLRYETLMEAPRETLGALYEFCERPNIGNAVAEGVRAASVGKGAWIELSAPVRVICDALLHRLDAVENRVSPCASSS